MRTEGRVLLLAGRMLLNGLSRAVCVSAGRAWPFPHAHTCSHTRISADPEGYRCWGMRGGGGQAAATLGARSGAHAGARAFWGQADLSSVKKKFSKDYIFKFVGKWSPEEVES